MGKQNYGEKETYLKGNSFLKKESAAFRGWEYARKGDYHRNLDPNWSYTPTYLRKMHHIRRFLSGLPKEVPILDVGCAEGALK